MVVDEIEWGFPRAPDHMTPLGREPHREESKYGFDTG
jgi:hypothetical protein